ncbi:c-type cytochrome [bacterium]|nr:c-type cytochrome [bacterium]
MVRKFPVAWVVVVLVLFGLFDARAKAETGAELFIRLTCYSCHGAEGRGMIHPETREKYLLKKKVFNSLKTAGVPDDIIKKLKPLNKKKFEQLDEFLAALAPLLGPADLKTYQALILEHGGRVYYRKGDLMRGFENYPILAGNKEIYLFTQMKDILEGRRINGNSDAMRGIKPFLVTNKITDKEFRLIARYLSQVKK